ncbi:MAG: Crp/Fnr family transcriptional regulator [Firmicutes bacterium]|nr:Crp/Fnr family transcriptional regulator [Bacillota bacterium]
MGQFLSFWGLTKEQITHMSEAGMLSVREFGKRQVLMNQDDDRELIGIMLKGDAFLESMNMEGQRRILDYFQEKESFVRKCFPEMERGVCYVISRCRCQVAFINERKLTSNDDFHETRAQILEEILMRAQRRAMMHADVLCQRSLRQKLLVYFGYLSRSGGRPFFDLPFSYTDCADYLAVDRSAMMRELGRMKDERIVTVDGRRLRLEAGERR